MAGAPVIDARPIPETLEALLSRAAGGDRGAFAAFYDATAPRVYGLAKRILRRGDLAEDACAEAYAQAWTNASSFDSSRSNAMAWMMVLTRSRALDLLRRRAREVEFDESIAESHLATDPVDDSFEVLAQFQSATQVAAALEKLSETQRRCIALAFFADLSHSEIAQRLAMPLGTVKTHLRSAIQLLRAALGVTPEGSA